MGLVFLIPRVRPGAARGMRPEFSHFRRICPSRAKADAAGRPMIVCHRCQWGSSGNKVALPDLRGLRAVCGGAMGRSRGPGVRLRAVACALFLVSVVIATVTRNKSSGQRRAAARRGIPGRRITPGNGQSGHPGGADPARDTPEAANLKTDKAISPPMTHDHDFSPARIPLVGIGIRATGAWPCHPL